MQMTFKLMKLRQIAHFEWIFILTDFLNLKYSENVY